MAVTTTVTPALIEALPKVGFDALCEDILAVVKCHAVERTIGEYGLLPRTPDYLFPHINPAGEITKGGAIVEWAGPTDEFPPHWLNGDYLKTIMEYPGLHYLFVFINRSRSTASVKSRNVVLFDSQNISGEVNRSSFLRHRYFGSLQTDPRPHEAADERRTFAKLWYLHQLGTKSSVSDDALDNYLRGALAPWSPTRAAARSLPIAYESSGAESLEAYLRTFSLLSGYSVGIVPVHLSTRTETDSIGAQRTKLTCDPAALREYLAAVVDAKPLITRGYGMVLPASFADSGTLDENGAQKEVSWSDTYDWKDFHLVQRSDRGYAKLEHLLQMQFFLPRLEKCDLEQLCEARDNETEFFYRLQVQMEQKLRQLAEKTDNPDALVAILTELRQDYEDYLKEFGKLQRLRSFRNYQVVFASLILALQVPFNVFDYKDLLNIVAFGLLMKALQTELEIRNVEERLSGPGYRLFIGEQPAGAA